jgi:predicted RNA-binding protein YlxR (DUF448 family)
VTGASGLPVPDPLARAPGRGAYVCRDDACVRKLARRAAGGAGDAAAIERAFRLAVAGTLVDNGPGESHEN